MAVWTLETERLSIRELEESDLEFVSQMLGCPNTMRFWPRPYSREEALEWIRSHQRRYREHGHGYWLLSLKDTAVPIGQVGLLRQELDTGPEVGLGYILYEPFWGNGYATEAAAACLDYGFRELGRNRVVILIRPENSASVRVAQRLGAQRVGSTEYAGFAHDVYARGPDMPR